MPYIRQFDRAAVIQGPIVLDRRVLGTGAFAEVELTLVAANPADHGLVGHG